MSFLFGAGAASAADPTGHRAQKGGVEQPIPSSSEVEAFVLRYFRTMPDYHAGDLITRKQVSPLLDKLRRTGLPLANAKQILDAVPADDCLLARQLSTPNGRRFMRRIAAYPDGYDRVDRLNRLPLGPQTVDDLIRGPDGDKMIRYMTTAPGGKAMGKMLSEDPRGADFNTPTGRLYTADLLVKRLEESRQAASRRQAK